MSSRTGRTLFGNSSGTGAHFAATRWSVVLAAGGDHGATDTRRALEDLIGIYWYPVYAYMRRRGHKYQEAQDLTQEFFAGLLERKPLASADQSKGSFRSFLLTMVKRFLINEWNRSQAQKRGGGRHIIAMDALDAEARYAIEPTDNLTPERLFDRRWAMAVLDQVLARLELEHATRGKAEVFDALRGCLADGPGAGYAHVAQKLGMSEGAVKVAAHRLRRRYRQLLREEIAQTVDSPQEVEAEIRHLMDCL